MKVQKVPGWGQKQPSCDLSSRGGAKPNSFPARVRESEWGLQQKTGKGGVGGKQEENPGVGLLQEKVYHKRKSDFAAYLPRFKKVNIKISTQEWPKRGGTSGKGKRVRVDPINKGRGPGKELHLFNNWPGRKDLFLRKKKTRRFGQRVPTLAEKRNLASPGGRYTQGKNGNVCGVILCYPINQNAIHPLDPP